MRPRTSRPSAARDLPPDAKLRWQLHRLKWKYGALVELRARKDEVQAAGMTSFGPDEAAERKRLFRRIAREFPGALRELDSLSRRQLEVRAAAVDEAFSLLERGEAPLLRGQWLAVIADYHRHLREALAVKRWIARRLPRKGEIPSDVVDAFLERLERGQRLVGGAARMGWSPPQRAALAAWLAMHHAPPGGSLLEWVWSRLEERHGLPRAELQGLVFEGQVEGRPPSSSA